MFEINKIYCENCLETMKRMPDNFIDLTVTSPPYDNLRNYNGYDFDFESIAKELFRVTKKGGVVVWVVGDQTKDGDESGSSFKQALYFKETGFCLMDTMIYMKDPRYPANYSYMQAFEYMFILSKERLTTFNPIHRRTIHKYENKIITKRDINGHKTKERYTQSGEAPLYNVWYYPCGMGCTTSDDVWEHPAVFPEDLAKDHITNWSNKGDLIYDPFMGSGTTAKMAHLLDRNWIGSEISQEYVDLAEKRIDPYLRQQKINF
jgi:DNA modification methylase